jgi:hypothetical protein
MNARIQTLADRAKKSVPHGLGVDKWIETYNEIFAKLLIEECMRTLDNNKYPEASQCLSDVYFGMKDNV